MPGRVVEPTEAAPLPVTVLSGFLGSGKTTLLKHLLHNSHGLRIAVIVNDIGAINVDAALIKNVTRTEEKVIALQNGCICCTLRGDLLEELVRLSELHEFDYVVVESSGISEPEQVAETFDSRLADEMMAMSSGQDGLDEDTKAILARIVTAGGMKRFARLDTTVTVIDAFTVIHDFDTDEVISSRQGKENVPEDDERTVSDLMVDQIEFADVIILNKIDMVTDETKARVRTLIEKLNHRAKIIEASYGKIDVKEIVNTNLFDLDRAQTGYGWLQDLHRMTVREINNKKKITPKPETEEYNVQNFVYKRYRPFHPKRLWALLYDKFIIQMEDDDDDDDDDDEDEDDEMEEAKDGQDAEEDDWEDEDADGVKANGQDEDEDEDEDDMVPPDNAVILQNKRAHPLFRRLFRSKGEFFLATRPFRAGDWSQAGAMITLLGGREWFCQSSLDEVSEDPDIKEMVLHDIEQGGEWGDRKQELVFIGENLDVKGLEAALDECLLTKTEFKAWEKIMRSTKKKLRTPAQKCEALMHRFPDGFPEWPGEDADEHDGHAHK